MRAACLLLLAAAPLLAAAQKRRPVRVHLRQPGQQDLAEVEQDDAGLSFKLQVRRTRPSASQTRKPTASASERRGAPRPAQTRQPSEKPVSSSRPAAEASEPRRPAGERRQAAAERGGTSSVQKQREGIAFVRQQGPRPGGPRQSVAVEGELFAAERSRPATGGGRRTGTSSPGGQPAGQTASPPPAPPPPQPPRKRRRKKKKQPRPQSRPQGRPAAETAVETSGSGGPRIFELDDAEIGKILQEAGQIGRSQRLIRPTSRRRSVRRRKKAQTSSVEEARSSPIADNEVTPAEDARTLLGKIMVKSRPTFRLPLRSRNVAKPRLHLLDASEGKEVKDEEESPAHGKPLIRFRSRGKLPSRQLGATGSPTRIDRVRVRSRIRPKIDPRSRETMGPKILTDPEANIPTISTKSTTQHILSTTTTIQPTFHLQEPDEVLPSTESYQEVRAGPLHGALAASTRGPLHGAPAASTPAPDAARDIEKILHRQKQRRGQVPIRESTGKSTDWGLLLNQVADESPRRLPPSLGRGRQLVAGRRAGLHPRGRHRLLTAARPRPYQSKVYGLPQVPTSPDGGRKAGTSSHLPSYLDIAIGHAEVTWSQDPFRQESILADAAQPTFDIDFSKDPTLVVGSQPKVLDTSIANQFATIDDTSKAHNELQQDPFVFGGPASGPASSHTKLASVGSHSRIRLFDPFTFYRNT